MWTGQEMSMAEALMISGLGLLVVFTALASLAIAIIIISKVLSVILKSDVPKAAAAAAAAPVPAIDEETYAVLLAAVSEEARLTGEEIRVTSIREL